MKRSFSYRWILVTLLVPVLALACELSAEVTPVTTPQETPLGATGAPPETLPAATDTSEPSATIEPVLGTAIAGNSPSCTILQDLNFRSGPGTAYRPPLKALPVNSVVIPLGYVPQGVPGGSWMYVQDPNTGEKGWISAGTQFVACTVDFAMLPSVAFGTPPPPPPPKTAVTSTPDGNCGEQYQCDVLFSDEFFVRFRLLKDGLELAPNDGVGQVQFIVRTLDGTELYSATETTPLYCIFGGNESCTPWPVEDYVYRWSAGGDPLQAGEYQLEILATVNNDSLRWAANFQLTLP